ncbi:MAG TPA: ABC transporter permease [Erysipelotrichaceae bacterium]|nr:ABC transporter permease [Erysipelotrichaceae bacterium]
MFKELYEYRELLKSSVKKEIRGKYKASFLGVIWSFVNPLLQVLVYAIVFPYLIGNRVDNYVVYLITGIIPWTFFSTVIQTCGTCIKANSGIIKKVYFPRIILPLSAMISGLINFFISCLIILLFCILFGVGISWHIVFVPLYALIEGVFALGIGMIVGACDAYVQDLEYIVNFLLQLAFYGTPIVYDIGQFESAGLLGKLVMMNPMTQIVTAFRDCFLYHRLPDFNMLVPLTAVALIMLGIGTLVFNKLEKGFAEQF